MIINFEGTNYTLNDAYSFKDFTNRSLADRVIRNTVVYGSCFLHETPDSVTFAANMSGVTFIKCNLDNVIIPAGNTIISCSQRRFKVQNDLRDWEVSALNVPLSLINQSHWAELGFSVLVSDIPLVRLNDISEIRRA